VGYPRLRLSRVHEVRISGYVEYMGWMAVRGLDGWGRGHGYGAWSMEHLGYFFVRDLCMVLKRGWSIGWRTGEIRTCIL